MKFNTPHRELFYSSHRGKEEAKTDRERGKKLKKLCTLLLILVLGLTRNIRPKHPRDINIHKVKKP